MELVSYCSKNAHFDGGYCYPLEVDDPQPMKNPMFLSKMSNQILNLTNCWLLLQVPKLAPDSIEFHCDAGDYFDAAVELPWMPPSKHTFDGESCQSHHHHVDGPF